MPTLFKVKPIRDKAWLQAHRDMACIVCGRQGQGDVVAAHIRFGNEGGTGLKPSDDLVIPLCYQHHTELDSNPPDVARWLVKYVLKPLLRRRYEEWKNGQQV